MKKYYITLGLITTVLLAQSQVVTDTVSLGAGYADQVWYSLENGVQGSAPKDNWDIAFCADLMDASIIINSAAEVTLWLYPHSDTSGWETVDTTGMTSWTPRYNSDTSWSLGAFNLPLSSNPFDMGWGIYNTATHYVTGDSLYIIRLTNGDYKKLWLQQLADGAYDFKYANLDGSSLQNASIVKADYTGINFIYYSMQTNTVIDREPVSADWDLLFTQYTAFIPTPYNVTGVLTNYGVTVADVRGIADPETYNDYASQAFLTPINTIGYDWKTYSGAWGIEDSLLYFVKSNTGDIWKVVFTGFDGSSSGSSSFAKEKLATTAITDIQGEALANLAVYPNPAKGVYVNAVYNFENAVSSAVLSVIDITGKHIYSGALETTAGMHSAALPVSGMEAGIYFVIIEFDGNRIQQKLMIR